MTGNPATHEPVPRVFLPMNRLSSNSASETLSKCTQKRVLLVSNQVMHYRVSVYNYFHRRFRESGFEFSVIADRLQKQNQTCPDFELREIPFDFLRYRKAIADLQP